MSNLEQINGRQGSQQRHWGKTQRHRGEASFDIIGYGAFTAVPRSLDWFIAWFVAELDAVPLFKPALVYNWSFNQFQFWVLEEQTELY